MDTSYNYPQLFDIDDTTFDTDLFHGLNLSDNASPNYLDKKQDYSLATNNNSYLQYLQNNNNNEFYYDTSSQQMLMLPPATMDLVDYDYFSQQPADQKQQYNWLYDPIDTFLPQQQHQNLFGDDNNTMVNQMNQQLDSIMSENIDENITTVQGGMSRGYVSLSVGLVILLIM